jgi:hypothetical protein
MTLTEQHAQEAFALGPVGSLAWLRGWCEVQSRVICGSDNDPNPYRRDWVADSMVAICEQWREAAIQRSDPKWWILDHAPANPVTQSQLDQFHADLDAKVRGVHKDA